MVVELLKECELSLVKVKEDGGESLLLVEVKELERGKIARVRISAGVSLVREREVGLVKRNCVS